METIFVMLTAIKLSLLHVLLIFGVSILLCMILFIVLDTFSSGVDHQSPLSTSLDKQIPIFNTVFVLYGVISIIIHTKEMIGLL